MIKRLHIENFILAKDITIEFGSGLNILSGETGAGKSVIIGALDYILGKQMRSILAYDKDKPVKLETAFDLTRQEMASVQNNLIAKIKLISEFLGFEAVNGSGLLIISKEISIKGKPTSFINGKRVNQAQLQFIRDILIDFHSQREQLNLFDDHYQMHVLDSWADLISIKDQYNDLYNEIKLLMEKKKRLEIEEKKSAEKLLLFEYQIDEIEAMNLDQNEETALNSELDLLTHSEELLTFCSELQHSFIEEDNSLMDNVASFHHRIEKFGTGNESIKNIISCFNEINSSLNSLINEVKTLEANIDLDESKMNLIEERIGNILRIKNKYKMDIPELLSYLQEMKLSIAEKSSRKEEIENLKILIAEKTDLMISIAEELSSKRKKAATPFSQSVINDLKLLAIPDGIFSVDITPLGKIYIRDGILGGLNETGNDKIDFLFSANKGSQTQSLKEVVSGGELSRLLLIIKKILAQRSESPTLVLDEIDTGIGGNTANSIGEYISKISDYHQVICITHLPQIACYGTKQFLINKSVPNDDIRADGNRKTTAENAENISNSLNTDYQTYEEQDRPKIEVIELSYEERRNEIARMLSGTKSEIALKHAKELLEQQ